MSNIVPRQGEIYRHFKGNLYQIVALAIHTETEETMVVYQALYGEFKHYTRPLKMFMEKVEVDDSIVNRFELVNVNKDSGEDFSIEDDNIFENSIHINLNRNDILEIMEGSLKDNSNEENCNLMGFLDAKTYSEKMNILKEMRVKGMLDDHILRNCAMSIDCVVDEDGIDEQYYSIMNCLNMLSKYECTRLR